MLKSLWIILYDTKIYQLLGNQKDYVEDRAKWSYGKRILNIDFAYSNLFEYVPCVSQDSKLKLNTTSLIAYHNGPLGWIHDQSTNDMGELLKVLKKNNIDADGFQYMARVSPVTVSMLTLNDVDINLHTDIWFPWVVGFMTDKPAQSKEDMYDNRQLAWRHTPRLNRCLAEIKQLIIEAGGTWEIGKDNVHEAYQHMVTETGIELGMPDDVKYLKNNE